MTHTTTHHNHPPQGNMQNHLDTPPTNTNSIPSHHTITALALRLLLHTTTRANTLPNLLNTTLSVALHHTTRPLTTLHLCIITTKAHTIINTPTVHHQGTRRATRGASATPIATTTTT